MDAVEYQRFTNDLVAWAAGEPAVIGLIAVGSTAALTHDPDEWSDHDVFVVATAEAATRLLEAPSWLPDTERIVLWHTETVEGRAAVYDDGHVVELAVSFRSGRNGRDYTCGAPLVGSELRLTELHQARMDCPRTWAQDLPPARALCRFGGAPC